MIEGNREGVGGGGQRTQAQTDTLNLASSLCPFRTFYSISLFSDVSWGSIYTAVIHLRFEAALNCARTHSHTLCCTYLMYRRL